MMFHYVLSQNELTCLTISAATERNFLSQLLLLLTCKFNWTLIIKRNAIQFVFPCPISSHYHATARVITIQLR